VSGCASAAQGKRAIALRDALDYFGRRGTRGVAAVLVLYPGRGSFYFERPELLAAALLEQAQAAA
jgi:hypothetical protein